MPEATTAAPPRARVRSRTFATLVDNPDYRRFYLGQGVSLIGTWLQDAAVSWIVYAMTGSEWMLGLVAAAGTLPGLFVGLHAGALADRVPPKTMILAMQTAQMALAFLLAALVFSGTVQIWQMALILAVTRVCVTFEMPSRQVFLYDLVGKSSLMNAIALNSGLFNASKIVGPALAGLILAKLGQTMCFTLNGASYLAAIAALMQIHRPHKPNAPSHDSGRDLLAGLRHVARDRTLTILFLGLTFFGVVGMGYSALMSAYAKRVMHLGVTGYGVLLASSALGATCGALVLASLGGFRRRHLLILGGMAIFGASLAAAGGLPPLFFRLGMRNAGLASGALGLFGAGVGALVFYAATQTSIQTNVPDALRGRIMGVWMITFSGSVPLGSICAGGLARLYGVSNVMVASAAVCMVSAGIAVLAGTFGRFRYPPAELVPAERRLDQAPNLDAPAILAPDPAAGPSA